MQGSGSGSDGKPGGTPGGTAKVGASSSSGSGSSSSGSAGLSGGFRRGFLSNASSPASAGAGKGATPQKAAATPKAATPKGPPSPASKHVNSEHEFCDFSGCLEDGKWLCDRCGERSYCCKDHQVKDWPSHSLTCNDKSGKGMPPLAQWYPIENLRRRMFTNEELLAGPDQPMDPPAEYAHILEYWQDRPFTVPGTQQVIMTSGFIGGNAKHLIREGLRAKELSWDYLVSDNFFVLIASATFPVDRLAVLIQMMRQISPKVSPQYQVECIIEHYWRTKSCVSDYSDFEPEMHNVLLANGLRIPLIYHGHSCDALRVFTHRGGFGAMIEQPPCKCLFCVKRPYKELIEEKTWEAVRMKQSDKGRFMMR